MQVVSRIVREAVPPFLQRVVRRVVREVVDDRVSGLAAEIAFYGVLGLFPALLMFASTLVWIEAVVGGEVADRGIELVTQALDRLFTEEADGFVAAVERLFLEHRPGIFTTATVGALWALSRTFGSMIVALDLAYDLPERRPWVRQRAIGLGIGVGTVLAGATALTMVVAGPILGGGQAVANRLGLGGGFAFAWTWLRWPTAFVLLVVWATTLFDVAPAHDRRWRTHLPGAITSAAGWLLVSLGLGLFLRLVGSGNPVYGVLGGAVGLLLWVYALSVVLLVGAEVNGSLLAIRTEDEGGAAEVRNAPKP